MLLIRLGSRTLQLICVTGLITLQLILLIYCSEMTVKLICEQRQTEQLIFTTVKSYNITINTVLLIRLGSRLITLQLILCY